MELYDRVVQFKYEQENLVKDLIVYFKWDAIPLERRWEMFKYSNELLPKSNWVIDIPEIENNDGNYYDDFYYDRHQTVDMVNLVETIEDYPEKYTKFNVEKVKEQILQTGYGSFVFDW